MFRKLRNHFIIMHMGIITLIFFMFFAAIVAFASNNINQEINNIFETQRGNEMRPMVGRPGNMMQFFISTTQEGDIVLFNQVTSPFSMDDAFYQGVFKEAVKNGKTQGRIKYESVNLAFKFVSGGIMFVDISREVAMMYSLVYIFLWIAIPLLILIFLVSIYFSQRAIKPIETSFNRQKEFVADASHELKTPLTTIATNADVVLKTATSSQKKWLENIKNEASRMASLVSSMLYLAKTDYEVELTLETVDLAALVETILLPLEAVIFEKNITMQTNVNAKIKADKAEMRRLIEILIDNAIKYTSGSIIIEGTHKILSIANSGAQISVEDQDKIFDRFYRTDKSRQFTGGFGLGLSIAKTIADKHGFRLSCKSDEKFTKFILNF